MHLRFCLLLAFSCARAIQGTLNRSCTYFLSACHSSSNTPDVIAEQDMAPIALTDLSSATVKAALLDPAFRNSAVQNYGPDFRFMVSGTCSVLPAWNALSVKTSDSRANLVVKHLQQLELTNENQPIFEYSLEFLDIENLDSWFVEFEITDSAEAVLPKTSPPDQSSLKVLPNVGPALHLRRSGGSDPWLPANFPNGYTCLLELKIHPILSPKSLNLHGGLCSCIAPVGVEAGV